MTDPRLSLFSRYTKDLLSSEIKSSSLPLKDHIHIPFIIDCLSRQHSTHIMIENRHSFLMQHAFLDAIAEYCMTHTLPKIVEHNHLLYIDLNAICSSRETSDHIKQDFYALNDILTKQDQRAVLIFEISSPFSSNDALSAFLQCIELFSTHERFRFILFCNQPPPSLTSISFISLSLPLPSKEEQIAILKTHRESVETFHHVMLADETYEAAFSFAKHYLAPFSPLKSAFELLESAAARASVEVNAYEHHDTQKPLVTSIHLAKVASELTHIPLSHLQQNTFQASKLTDVLRHVIFGQDIAIQATALLLQNAYLRLQKNKGPLCSFLFAGPEGVGKKTLAYTLAEHLFGHQRALLHVSSASGYSDKLYVSRDDDYLDLLTAIEQTPYGIILVENMHAFSEKHLSLFQTVLTEGVLCDDSGKKYDFQHAIFILTISVEGDPIALPRRVDQHKTLDLMQLVLNDNKENGQESTLLTRDELCQKMRPLLTKEYPLPLLRHFNLIPFTALDDVAYEAILHVKLKTFKKRLETHFNIELSYAPEVIAFLANDIIQEEAILSIDKKLEEKLYSCVAHEMIAHSEHKNKPRRLVLQLNESGALLRCDFVTSTELTMTPYV